MRTEFDAFFAGHCLDAYNLFGAHPVVENDVKGIRFTVWAPHARSLRVTGDFNQWNQDTWMEKVDDRGVWSVFVEAQDDQIYKYIIEQADGTVKMKVDPFAFYSELRPKVGSIVKDIEGYKWKDSKWMKSRDNNYEKAMNIYEVNAGSWKRNEDGSWYSYDQLGKELIPYCEKNGYTHIEFMPLAEFPFDGSWGYQGTGYFSCTSRYGQAKDFMKLVDYAHRHNVGVIMDFVPVHFVRDDYALRLFDGTPQFEYDKKEDAESEWGTLNFNLWREEVRSFLMSAAAFWLDKYHMDGIRVDAVSNLIFWGGNKNRGENKGATDFVKRMNYNLHDKFKGIMMIAEDSSDFQLVTQPTEYGGLGFDYKWDLGWMNDTLKYYAMDPIYRKWHHNLINWSMAYFYGEHFIMPLSHDEVVHGKHTIIDKMWGSYEQKFAQVKNLYLYMYTHPGKKLNFMGNETAQFREWDEDKEIDWFLLKYPTHDSFYRMTHDLSHIYVYHKALWEYDYHWDKGFKWIDADNNEQSIYSYYREDKESVMVVVLNMTPASYEKFELEVPVKGIYTEIFNTDKDIYSGYNMCNYKPIKTVHKGKKDLLRLRLAPFAGVMFEIKK